MSSVQVRQQHPLTTNSSLGLKQGQATGMKQKVGESDFKGWGLLLL